MKKFFLLFYFLLHTVIAHADISDAIIQNYKAHLYTLSCIKQEHFAVRMYRLTGDEQYLYPIMNYLVLLSTRLNGLIEELQTKTHIDLENQRLLQTSLNDSDKKIMRRNKIKDYHNIAFDLNFLILVHKIYFYHLEKSPLTPNLEKALSYLRGEIPTLKAFLLDEANIKIYGAQLINYVYFLLNLDLVDLRPTYTQQFKNAFPDTKDKELNTAEFSAKIYGMTHFIVADSNYYQKEVNTEAFRWIIKYFDKHIDEIVDRLETDIIAEVGVCYLLMHEEHNPTVQKIKTFLEKAYAEKAKLIPNKEKSYDLAQGEHRNILSIMFFKWHNKQVALPKDLFQKLLSAGFILSHDQKVHYGFDLI